MKNLSAEIVDNKKIGKECFLMDLRSEYIAGSCKPGQFIHTRIKSNAFKPFLRRPFSINKVVSKDTLRIVYKIVGEGTKILASKKKGQELNIIGPLGNGFELSLKKNNLLIAGGAGAAPLFFLAQYIKKIDFSGKIFCFLGAASADKLILEDEFKKLGIETLSCTEDGSCGKKTLLTRLFRDFLDENSFSKAETAIFACGPNPMLKALIEMSKKLDIPCQVSVEEMFACGVGACLGCAVNTVNGYKLACKDGPVFNGDEIIL